MGILSCFDEWKKYTFDVYEKTTSRNAVGQVEQTETLIQSGLKGFLIISNSVQTNTADQFSNDETGHIYIDPAEVSFTPTNNFIFKSGAVDYFIEGVNNVAGFSEVYKLLYRRERK